MCVIMLMWSSAFFFFNDTATTEIYTLSLHDALPICRSRGVDFDNQAASFRSSLFSLAFDLICCSHKNYSRDLDRKSTRLNSSHANISYAVFCLKKNNS